MNPIIYLISPIDQVRQAQLRDLNRYRRFARIDLKVKGFYVYDPSRAIAGKPATAQVRAINQAAMLEAAGALVIWPEGIPSTGAPAEIAWFRDHDIPLRRPQVDRRSIEAAIDSLVDILLPPKPVLGVVTPEQARIDLGLPAVRTLEIGNKRDTRAPSDSDLRFRRSYSTALFPTRSHRDDVGWDLYALEPILIQPGQSADVPFGVQMAAPQGWWGRITGRSSTLRTRGLAVQEGVIDPGYRGDLYAACLNTTDQAVTVQRGDRVAQLVLMPTHHVRAVEVLDLPRSDRGDRGYGSTGA